MQARARFKEAVRAIKALLSLYQCDFKAILSIHQGDFKLYQGAFKALSIKGDFEALVRRFKALFRRL